MPPLELLYHFSSPPRTGVDANNERVPRPHLVESIVVGPWKVGVMVTKTSSLVKLEQVPSEIETQMLPLAVKSVLKVPVPSKFPPVGASNQLYICIPVAPLAVKVTVPGPQRLISEAVAFGNAASNPAFTSVLLLSQLPINAET